MLAWWRELQATFGLHHPERADLALVPVEELATDGDLAEVLTWLRQVQAVAKVVAIDLEQAAVDIAAVSSGGVALRAIAAERVALIVRETEFLLQLATLV